MPAKLIDRLQWSGKLAGNSMLKIMETCHARWGRIEIRAPAGGLPAFWLTLMVEGEELVSNLL
jgi:hypothetical protein